MKTLIKSLLVIGLLFGCAEHPTTYTKKTLREYNKMISPITLFAKAKDENGLYSVTLLDGNDDVHQFSSMSRFANDIGQTYKKGDTIKK
tara:strand:+ start:208268 stop:208534 length:267 start_codon:yes stop_codon:yes gene_type:complete